MDQNNVVTLQSPRFGECTYTESDVFELPWGLPGFPNLRRWLALSIAEQPNFVWLQSLDDVAVALPTADPYLIFDEYDPKLPAYATAALSIESAADFTLLCVIVVTENAEEMTMNLMAPIIVNLRTRRARQVMLENSGYSVRARIPRKAAEGEAPSPASAT